MHVVGKLFGAAVLSLFYVWLFDLRSLKDKTLGSLTFGELITGIFGVAIIAGWWFIAIRELNDE